MSVIQNGDMEFELTHTPFRNKEYEAMLRRALERRLEQAGSKLEDAIRQKIAQSFPPSSKPGDPPRSRSGRLIASVRSEVNERDLALQVGVAAPYAKYLEAGTRTMGKRPFVRDTLKEQVEAVNQQIVGEKI